jgi:ATP-dependent DNA helicase RecG
MSEDARVHPNSAEFASIMNYPAASCEVSKMKESGLIAEASFEELDPERLKMIAAEIRRRRKAPKESVENLIVQLCRGRFLLLKELSPLLGRSPETIRTHYLAKMIKQGRVRLLYPGKPSHPQQRYMSSED